MGTKGSRMMMAARNMAYVVINNKVILMGMANSSTRVIIGTLSALLVRMFKLASALLCWACGAGLF